uniref:Uncharacterized protein n=1 Tax=Aquisalinus luteolus TaxID=1566827 RepID=A0A8J3EVY9_9PROT|nr:hypothetical protein GCM10011355_34440 [Aquisalinus luteolus]
MRDLASSYKIDTDLESLRHQLIRIGGLYLAECKNNLDELRAAERKEYQKILAEIDRFGEALETEENYGLAPLMQFAAIRAQEPPPQTTFHKVTEFQKSQAAPYYLELVRLLRLLRTGVEDHITMMQPPKGRKGNSALRDFVLRLSIFWTENTGRKFSFDHHEGQPLTEAYEFVQSVACHLDPNIPEAQIKTAMRYVIGQRNEWEKRANEASNAASPSRE